MSKNDKVKGLILLAIILLLVYLKTKSILTTILMVGQPLLFVLIFVLPIMFLLDRTKRSLKGFLRDSISSSVKK